MTAPDDTQAVPSASLAPGSMLGEYRVDRLLGAGTFGEVYAGEQPLIGKRVALKLLRERLSARPDVVTRFIAEARAVNLIRHRNIIDIFSFGVADGRHYFVMELLEGLTLGELLDREKRLSPAAALPILRGVAEALDAAHAAGVAHRDVKPDNVFLVPDGDGGYAPKLLDFGIAKLLTEELGIKTATGVAMGTPRYMSPEQCRGKNVDHRADIYALGVLTHEVLTGHAPFEGGTPLELLLMHACEAPPRMSTVCAALPPELDAPVLAMLAKKPADRPASAGAAVAALAGTASAKAAVITPPLGTIRMGAPVAAEAALPAATVRIAKIPQPAMALERTQVSAGASPAATVGPISVTVADLPRTNGALYGVAGILAATLLGVAAFGALHGHRNDQVAPAASAPPAASPPPPSITPATQAPPEPPAPRPVVTPAAAPSSAPTATGRSSATPAARPPAPPRSSERDLGF